MRLNPNVECLGDPRWTGDLILSTWHEAETGTFLRRTWNTGTAIRAEALTGSGSSLKCRNSRMPRSPRPRKTSGALETSPV